MLNAWDGVARLVARFRPAKPDRPATTTPWHRGAVRLARRIVDVATGDPTLTPPRPLIVARHEARRPAPAARRRSIVRRQLVVRLANERSVPLGVALVVLLAGIVSLGPSVVGPVGAAQPDNQPVRLAIGGAVPQGVPQGDTGLLGGPGLASDPNAAAGLDDGTLYKPVAVDTTVQSGRDLLRHYTVRAGDTLSGIAARFGVSLMTIWWANHLTSKDALHVGEVLVIPPVNGLIITVQAGDTLDSLAAKYNVSGDDILAANELTDPVVIVGQVLVIPGAKGAPIATPKPVVRQRTTQVLAYVGGAWAWPVVGGGNYISQYYSSYHPALDIAAKYGTPEVAPRAGRVIWAGWKSGGGAYQVWIDHGDGYFTAQLHMSAVLVAVGQWVAKGQQVGRVGMSGHATGPHDHYEIWVGHPWRTGSYRVNPLRYY